HGGAGDVGRVRGGTNHPAVENEGHHARGPLDDRGVPGAVGGAGGVGILGVGVAFVVHERADCPGQAAFREIDLAVAPVPAVGPQQPGGLIPRHRVGLEAHHIPAIEQAAFTSGSAVDDGFGGGDHVDAVLSVQVEVHHAVADADDLGWLVGSVAAGVVPPIG